MTKDFREVLFDSPSENDALDLKQYIKTIKAYSGRILILALAFTTLCAVIVLRMTPQFSSTATLIIEANKANVVSIEEVYGLDTERKDYMQTQYEILRSRKIAERTVESLSLHKNIDFIGNEPSKSFLKSLSSGAAELLPFLPQSEAKTLTEAETLALQKKRAVNKLIQSVSISMVKNTQILKITVTTAKPSLSADIANAMADVFIESHLQAKLDMTEKATRFLTNSLDGLQQKLQQSEKTLSEFYEENQVVNLDGVVGLAATELEQLNKQLLEAQTSLEFNSLIYKQTRAGVSIESLARIPEVLNHPLIQDVRREESRALTKVSELAKTYGPKHPTMISAQAELDAIQETFERQIDSLISSIATQYTVSQERVTNLQQEVSEAKARFRRLAALDNKRKTLERERDTNQQLYDSFFTRLKETDELGGFESANASVLDEALASSVPSKPNKKLLVIAAFVLSAGLGVVLALVMDFLNSGIRSVEDVERKLGQRMLGLIPWLAHKKKTDLPIRTFFDGKQHQFAEAVRTLRTSLSLLNLERDQQAIMVTSSVPKEGKTTVSINLAFALGQLDKTILVEADLRRPTVAKQFNVPSYQPGVANLVLKSHTFEECLIKDEDSNIDILTAGTIPSNPQELLASEAFQELITELKTQYKYVVVDTAPTQAVSDSMIVANSCDSVLYVVKADSTSDKVIKSGLARFIQVGHRVDGVILNQVNLKKSDVAQRYGGFYDEYGYTSHKS